MEKQFERRGFATFEVRLDDAGSTTKRMEGYPAKFNVLSEEMGLLRRFREKIARGAFAESIKTADVRFLVNHDGLPLARTKAGTLRLFEDDIGLRFEADLDATDPDVQRLIPKMKRGDVSQMSFAFTTKRDSWDQSDPQNVVRTLEEVDLFDVSIVTYPAYPQTEAHVRSAQDVYDSYVASLRAQDEATKIARQRALQAERDRFLRLHKHI